jgi:hypothetical protein
MSATPGKCPKKVRRAESEGQVDAFCPSPVKKPVAELYPQKPGEKLKGHLKNKPG